MSSEPGLDPARRVAQTATLSTGALFDEVPALRDLDPADPYPAYNEIFGPPIVIADGAAAVVTRHATCAQLLRRADVSARRDTSPVFRGLKSSDFSIMDPPEHTRIRRLVNKALTPRSIQLLEPWLSQRVHELLDDVDDSGFDVVDRLAYPLPLEVICQLLGVPAEHRTKIMEWSKPIAVGVDLLGGRRSRDQQRAYRSTVRDFRQLLEVLTDARREAPQEDLLSRLCSPDDSGEELTRREVLNAASNLLIAGHETTVSLIGHGVLALVQHPHLRQEVARDPDVTQAFVEEVLRLDSPIQAQLRVARSDMTLDGVRIRAGCALLLMLGAANRDPDQFPRPDRFDLSRPSNRTHLAFGGGSHFCVGAPLARTEGRLALSAIAARVVNPRLRSEGLTYAPRLMLRTPDRLMLDTDAVLPAASPVGP